MDAEPSEPNYTSSRIQKLLFPVRCYRGHKITCADRLYLELGRQLIVFNLLTFVLDMNKNTLCKCFGSCSSFVNLRISSLTTKYGRPPIVPLNHWSRKPTKKDKSPLPVLMLMYSSDSLL